MTKRVAVLMGGWSSEREVSLSSGAGCVAALRKAGYDVTPIDLTRDLAALLRALDPKPDVVFNILHGPFGEDGRVQGLLDMLGIPYTNSGALPSALGMDKAASRAVFKAAGLPMPPGEIWDRTTLLAHTEPQRPYVVKPINEGSSVGVHVVFEGDNIDLRMIAGDLTAHARVIVEQFVPGREIQVAVMGDRALGAIEIRTKRRFYDYVAKYTPGESEHLMPAPIHADAYRAACELGVSAHEALGCRGVSRVDLRYDDTKGEPGTLYLLEVNTQPGMTPTSLVPEIARHNGVSFESLVSWMVENAACDA
ncbi:MAG: D-alanine--D-alanine ligase [Rhodospirillaceae bacterium]|nr:D-alanine--D-alanine ligase [Rhodospirillaceae bacterium]